MPSLVSNSLYLSSFLSASGSAILIADQGKALTFIESNSSSHVASSTLLFSFVSKVN